MAVSKEHGGLDLIHFALMSGVILPRSRWAFLGNQRVKGFSKIVSVKPLFELFGAQVLMIDANGKDGAVAHDLRRPFDENEHGRYDVTTNFGTSEHVRNRVRGDGLSGQAQTFKTVHDLTKPGGLMLHAVPRSGGCLHHGTNKYNIEWFKNLAAQQGYQILHAEERPVPHEPAGDDQYVIVAMRKQKRNVPFNTAKWIDPPHE